MRRFFLILWLLLIVAFIQIHATDSLPMDTLKARTLHFADSEQWDSVIVYGNRWFEAAYEVHDWHGHIIEAHITLGIAYAHIGEYSLALNNLGQAHANATTIQNTEMVNAAFREVLQIAQEEQRHIIEHRKNQQLMWGGIVTLLLTCGLLGLMYRQKSRLLLAIVRQNHEALKFTAQVERKGSSQTDTQKQQLLARLEQMMQEKRIYCENLLTKDRVAELLQTNRTYLSEVVNEAYGKSFTQYINDLRINEAIRLLDNPENERPLKLIGQDLGFNSPTTFNTQFRHRTGMTPAQYRSKVKQLDA